MAASTSAAVSSKLPASMRCIVYSKGGHYASKTVPTPRKGRRGHVLVRVHAAGLNPVDAKGVVGDKLPANWKMARSWADSFLDDKCVGFDFSGEVLETHEGYTTGDHVFGTMPPFAGSLAEYLSVPIHQMAIRPQNYTAEQAAALPLVGLTALQALAPHAPGSSTTSSEQQEPQQQQQRNKSILIVGGSGGTGHVAIQVARSLGFGPVVSICSSSKADFCREMGADHIVDYTPGPEGVEEALQKCPGAPFDLVLDCVTSDDPRDVATINYPKLLQKRNPDADKDSSSRKHLLLSDEYVYRRLGGHMQDWVRAGLERTVGGAGLWWGGKRERIFWIRFPHSAPELKRLAEWANQGQLMPFVDPAHVYEFGSDSVQKAMDALLSRRVKGKVVVRVADAAPSSGESNE